MDILFPYIACITFGESNAKIAAPAIPPPRRAPLSLVHCLMTTILWAKFPTEVNNLLLQFAGMPQEQVLNIFHNQFEPINLYQIRYMHGLPHEPCYSQEEIGIEDGMLYSMKILGLYKGLGSSLDDVWLDAFVTYTLPIKYSAMIK